MKQIIFDDIFVFFRFSDVLVSVNEKDRNIIKKKHF